MNQVRRKQKFQVIIVLFVGFFILSAASAAPCTQPDNGTGTATLPPIGCEYMSPDEVFMIIDGLPPGTTNSSNNGKTALTQSKRCIMKRLL